MTALNQSSGFRGFNGLVVVGIGVVVGAVVVVEVVFVVGVVVVVVRNNIWNRKL